MSRVSGDKFDEKGNLIEGYDYQLQVWVFDGTIQDCGHPKSMCPGSCNGDKYAGRKLTEVKNQQKA